MQVLREGQVGEGGGVQSAGVTWKEGLDFLLRALGCHRGEWRGRDKFGSRVESWGRGGLGPHRNVLSSEWEVVTCMRRVCKIPQDVHFGRSVWLTAYLILP